MKEKIIRLLKQQKIINSTVLSDNKLKCNLWKLDSYTKYTDIINAFNKKRNNNDTIQLDNLRLEDNIILED